MADLSLVIPCYNEEKNIKELFEQISKLENKFNLEAIIVNNGSTDDSSTIIDSEKKIIKNLKVIKIEKNIGFGNGVKEGVKNATSNLICYAHGDLQTNLEDVYKAYNIYKTSNLGKKFIKGSRQKRPLIDVTFTFLMSLINSILFRKVLYDIHAQPNLFERSLIKNFDFVPNDMSLDLYMILNAKINDYKIIKFKVNFLKRRFGIGSNENFLKKVKYSLHSLFSSLSILFHGRF